MWGNFYSKFEASLNLGGAFALVRSMGSNLQRCQLIATYIRVAISALQEKEK